MSTFSEEPTRLGALTYFWTKSMNSRFFGIRNKSSWITRLRLSLYHYILLMFMYIRNRVYFMTSVRISNLGWHFFPLKVALGNPYLSCLWIDLAKFLVNFWPRFKSKVYQISDKSVHIQLRKGVSDATFGGNKRQPKLQIRTLFMTRSLLRRQPD